MDPLLFLEDKHTYLLYGEKLPCVSDLCRFLHREIYRNTPAWRIEDAAIKGTAVHTAAQSLDKNGFASINSDYLPYLTAYKTFLQEHSVSWSMVEHPMYHPQERYAGTIDRYGLVDGLHTLIDLKTTYTVYKPLCLAQLNLYRLILIARGYPVDRMFILHLRRDGTYKLIKFLEDNSLTQSLITIHNALAKRKKRKEQPNV